MSWILLGLIVAAGLYAISAYNRLVSLRNSSENAVVSRGSSVSI